MNRIFFLKLTLAVCIGSFFSGSCNNQSDGNTSKMDTATGVNNAGTETDTLQDTPQFVFSIDDKEFSVSEENVTATYLPSDSSITLFAKTGDTSGLYMLIPRAYKTFFSVPTGYSSVNTRIAFSEELAVQPTVILNNYPEVDVSFNNLDDGYHKKEPQPNAITVTSYRQLEGGSNMQGWNFLLKGYIHTTVLKSVYAGKDKAYNHDYKIKGKFVIRFKSYF